MCDRAGTVYGCGSTRHGQLPYLKFSSDDEKMQARNEITQATRLKLPMLQVGHDPLFPPFSSLLCLENLRKGCICKYVSWNVEV